MSERSVTQLLSEWRQGSESAREELIPVVYRHLRSLAASVMSSERQCHTLPATALVHEAYLRLVDADVPYQDRAHFFMLAARTMRRILVDYARAQRREKRGGGSEVLSLEQMADLPASPASSLPELDFALEKLMEMDPRKAQLVDLIYFGGLTYDESAAALEISPATVHRELRVAKAWLYQQLCGTL